MVCAPTELQQNTPARAVNELHRAGAPLFYKENAQSGDFRQYRIILSAAAAGAVLKPSGGNCAVLPLEFCAVECCVLYGFGTVKTVPYRALYNVQ